MTEKSRVVKIIGSLLLVLTSLSSLQPKVNFFQQTSPVEAASRIHHHKITITSMTPVMKVICLDNYFISANFCFYKQKPLNSYDHHRRFLRL